MCRVGLDARETPRDISFCGHAIMADKPLIVPDTHRDARFADNPLVLGPPYVRAYLGVPIVTAEGHALGTLCAIPEGNRDGDGLGLCHRGADSSPRAEGRTGRLVTDCASLCAAQQTQAA